MTIHAQLKAARLKKGLSMEQLAQRISEAENSAKPLAWQTVQQWEAGRSAPKRTRLDLVRQILDLSIPPTMTQSVGTMTQDIGADNLPPSTSKLPSPYSAVMEIANLINAADKPARIAIGGLLQHLCEKPEDAELTARRISALLAVKEIAEPQRSTR